MGPYPRITRSDLADIAILTVIYLVTAKFGLLFSISSGNVTALWLPSGIAAAALLLRGIKVTPGIWLGTAIASATTEVSLVTAGVFGIGNVLEGLIFLLILNYLTVDRVENIKLRWIGSFVFATFLSCVAAATTGSMTLFLQGYIPLIAVPENWLTWWLGDAAGILVITPAIISWSGLAGGKFSTEKWREWIIFGICLISVFTLIYGGILPDSISRSLPYLALIFSVWAAFRLGDRGVTGATLLIVSISLAGVIRGTGPFTGQSLNGTLLSLQCFMSITSVTGLGVVAIVNERDTIESHLIKARDELEGRVRDRTAHLQKLNEELSQSEKRYRLLFEGVDEGIVILEATGENQGDIVAANRAAGLMHGYLVKDMVSLNIRDLDAPECRDGVLKRIEAVLAGGWIAGELVHRRSDGSHFPVDFHAGLLDLTDHLYVLVLFRDISERKHAQEALELSNRKLNLLNSITRHDILNSLNAFFLICDLIQNRIEALGITDTKLSEKIGQLRQAGESIERQIGFTRDYQRIGVRSPSWQNVPDIIREAAQGIDLKGVELRIDLPRLLVYADPLLVKVFYNLIENGIRHGGKKSFIRFSYEPGPDGQVIICEDDGEGIPDDAKEMIFTREYYSHTGFGLYLSRDILSITGLTIRERGVQGEGARFEILVPEHAARIMGLPSLAVS